MYASTMAGSKKMSFKAMYLVSEDYLKDMKKKNDQMTTTATSTMAQTSVPAVVAPSFPPPPPPAAPSVPPVPPSVPPPSPPALADEDDEMTNPPPTDNDLMDSRSPPNREPDTLVVSSNDNNATSEDRTDTQPSGSGDGGRPSKVPKVKVQFPSTSQEIRPISKTKFVCPLCNAEFKSKLNLGTHVRTRHRGEKAFVCKLCKNRKMFETENTLNRHLKEVHFSRQVYEREENERKRVNPNAATLKRKRMQSDPRDDPGKTPETVEKRIKTVSSQEEDDDDNPMKCKECNKIFVDFRDFNQHITTAHNQPKGRDFM